jgi:hypothetical protein
VYGIQVFEIQAVVQCIMEEKDRLHDLHREQLRGEREAAGERERQVGGYGGS